LPREITEGVNVAERSNGLCLQAVHEEVEESLGLGVLPGLAGDQEVPGNTETVLSIVKQGHRCR